MSRHFGIFHAPKHVTTGSKRHKNTCVSIASGLGTTLKKHIFFAPGTTVDPRWPQLRPIQTPWSLHPETLFGLKIKKTKPFMIFRPQKRGGHFLTPTPSPHPICLKSPQKWVSSGWGGLGGSGPKTHWGMCLLDKIMNLQGVKLTIQPPPTPTDPKIVARNSVLCRRRRRRRFCFRHTAGGIFFVPPHVSILKILRILWRIQKWLKTTKRLCSHLAHFWATSDSAPRGGGAPRDGRG